MSDALAEAEAARDAAFASLAETRERLEAFLRRPPPTGILIVEDKDDDAFLLQHALRKAGFGEFVLAGTCAAAEPHLRSGQIRAALYDEQLPDGNGHALAADTPRVVGVALMSDVVGRAELLALRERTRADEVVSKGDLVGLVEAVQRLFAWHPGPR